MSTRYIKKVYGNSISIEEPNESASDVEIPVTGDNKSKSFNAFCMLDLNSQSENETQDQKCVTDVPPKNVKQKKKKKRRKKADSSKVPEKCDSESGEEIDEIERSVREVNKLLGEPAPGCSRQDTADTPQWITQKSKESILCVQHKHLNPYNELKKIFGSKTVQAEQSKRRNRAHWFNLKKTWLTTPKAHWPPFGKLGLSMSLDHSTKSTGNVQYFTYEHNPTYRETQLKFLEAVESRIPENIIRIVHAHFYHVDALLQVAEMCKLTEDLATAAEFTEQALYCLECAFHPLFNVTTALCRLNYRIQQNRTLFITLFKHLTFVGGRACYRTSLEFCKLLLSLDAESDPLAMVLCIDFYALRAKEYEWFIEFCNLWDNTRNLTQLPNIAYSLALAHFQLGHDAISNELLQNALIMFPGVLMALLEKCSIQTDDTVMKHKFFTNIAKTTTPPALEKLQDLYIARCFHLWKEAKFLPWLKDAAHATLARVDSNDNYIKYCQMKRCKRYQGRLPRNILRHIIVADLKDVTVNGDEIQNEGPILSHDPLPPLDSIDIYKKPTTNNRPIQNNSNLLSLFFSSLFVGVNEDAPDGARNGVNLF